ISRGQMNEDEAMQNMQKKEQDVSQKEISSKVNSTSDEPTTSNDETQVSDEIMDGGRENDEAVERTETLEKKVTDAVIEPTSSDDLTLEKNRLSDLNLGQLRKKANELGVKFNTKTGKVALIDLILNERKKYS